MACKRFGASLTDIKHLGKHTSLGIGGMQPETALRLRQVHPELAKNDDITEDLTNSKTAIPYVAAELGDLKKQIETFRHLHSQSPFVEPAVEIRTDTTLAQIGYNLGPENLFNRNLACQDNGSDYAQRMQNTCMQSHYAQEIAGIRAALLQKSTASMSDASNH